MYAPHHSNTCHLAPPQTQAGHNTALASTISATPRATRHHCATKPSAAARVQPQARSRHQGYHQQLGASPRHMASAAPSPAGATAGAAAPAAQVAAAAGGTSGSAEPSAVDAQAYNQRWTDLWEGGLQKGQHFDKGQCSPQLLQLISSGSLPVQDKKAIVPGCGRGYDVFAFAAVGAAVAVGLDLCPAAVAAAQAEAEANTRLANDSAALSRVHLVAGDFFSHADSAGFQGPFHVGYDYTFLCALHPDMRQGWAQAWHKILAPGGELVTMVYPVDPSRPNEGPPWPVTPELYKQLLLPAGFELLSLEPIPAGLSHEGRAGREWLGRWRNTGS